MFLRNLTIIKNKSEIVRSIPFKLGVNLIVDTSIISNKTNESGNDVGKTTVLRLVDYLLGAEATNIYTDPEFQTEKTIVKDFLEKQGVELTLLLAASFDKNEQNKVLLKRNFGKGKKQIFSINDVLYSKSEYKDVIKRTVFNLDDKKPTLREIVPRFIRNDAVKMDKIIKYLPYGKNDVYESVYLFLFGIKESHNFFVEKSAAKSELKFEKKVLKETFQSKSANTIEQHLDILRGNIEELEYKKKNCNFSPKYQEWFDKLGETKKGINIVSSELSKKRVRLDFIQDNISELKNNFSTVDSQLLKILYDEAQRFIPNLQKSFDDIVSFHNTLVQNKLNFLSKDINPLKEEVRTLDSQLSDLLKNEENIVSKLSHSGSLGDYELLTSELNIKYEQKGKLEGELEQIKSIENSIKVIEEKLEEINKKLESFDSIIHENIKIFNRFFSKYSDELYDGQFALSHKIDDKNECYKFVISNVSGAGDGKKKGLISAFDLAYISFCNELNLSTLHFAMHDRIEGIHGNQLKSLFEIVNNKDFRGQYVASVLSDKFKSEQLKNNYLEENKILELSENNRLFKIEDER